MITGEGVKLEKGLKGEGVNGGRGEQESVNGERGKGVKGKTS